MPSKAQATQLPTFGAFKKFETHMQNRLPSSTKNSYREENRDFRVFLKACDEPASQLNLDRVKIFLFPEIKFFQQISQQKKSSRIFAFRRIRDTLWLKPQNGGGLFQNVEKLQNFEWNAVLSITLILARVLEYFSLIF